MSDQDYLREFDSGYSGYEHSDEYFNKEFGRGLDDNTETVRLSQLNVNRGWDTYSLNADVRWYDDVIIRKHDQDDNTLQNLPSVTFDGAKQRISNSPLYFDLKTSYDHFWRDVGTRGYGADLYPRVYYPVSLFKYFDFEPSAGVRETLWQIEEYEPRDPDKEDQLESREIYDLKGDLSTEVSRVFNLGGRTIDKMQHAIRPQVVYEYVPDLKQEELPDFVAQIERKNRVTYSVTNNFTLRMMERQRPKADPEKQLESEQEPPPPKYRYHDLCRFKLSQSYDMVEARQENKPEGRRPFSDVTGELEFMPFSHLALKGDAAWSIYDHVYNSYNAVLLLSDRRGDNASVDYRYTRESNRSVVTELFVNLLGPLSANFQYERNLDDDKDVRTSVGVEYESQCWSLKVTYTDDRIMNEREYFFQIGLYGLGQYGLGKYRPDKGKNTWKKMG